MMRWIDLCVRSGQHLHLKRPVLLRAYGGAARHERWECIMAAIDGLFFKYGHRITSGVAEFLYDRIEADTALAPFFEGVNLAALRDHMADLLSVLTGGPDMYKGQDIGKAHADLNIDEAAFNRVAGHLVASLEQAGIAPEDAAALLEVIARQKAIVISA